MFFFWTQCRANLLNCAVLRLTLQNLTLPQATKKHAKILFSLKLTQLQSGKKLHVLFITLPLWGRELHGDSFCPHPHPIPWLLSRSHPIPNALTCKESWFHKSISNIDYEYKHITHTAKHNMKHNINSYSHCTVQIKQSVQRDMRPYRKTSVSTDSEFSWVLSIIVVLPSRLSHYHGITVTFAPLSSLLR